MQLSKFGTRSISQGFLTTLLLFPLPVSSLPSPLYLLHAFSFSRYW